MNPVGVYDSGFGGLSVLRELRAMMPDVDYVYLGDNGRAPYGGRDANVILDFAEQCVERLFSEGCSVVVVACHTVSSVALRHLQTRYSGRQRAVLGVTIPAAELAVRESRGQIGWIATARTVASGTFSTEVAKLAGGSAHVAEVAAPLLAPIVEEGWENTDIARSAVQRYVQGLAGVDTVVLGCTHYPLLMPIFREVLAGVRVLDPAPFVAERLSDWFFRHGAMSPSRGGSLRVLSTGNAESFARHGARFLGAPMPAIETVAEIGGRLVERPRGEVRGQIVRSLP